MLDMEVPKSLAHLPTLTVSEDLARTRFRAGCSMTRCSGRCCRSGAWVDPVERDRILRHAETVQACMDAGQMRDPSRWFEGGRQDPDFPSGRAVGTAVNGAACVFLDAAGRCAVHAAEARVAPGTGTLKPFFCRAFPVTIESGVLGIDEEHGRGEHACCGSDPDGPLSVFDVCADELAFVLGPEAVAELKRSIP